MDRSTKKLSKAPKYVRLSTGSARAPARAAGAQHLDVRYMRNLMNFKQTLVSPDCNQQECPMMRERLHKHVHAHRSTPTTSIRSPSVLQASNPPVKLTDQCISVAPSFSRLQITRKMPKHDAQSAQTNLTSAEMDVYANICETEFTNIDSQSTTDRVAFISSRIRNINLENNKYRVLLNDIVSKWVRDLPMFQTLNFKDKEIMKNITHNFIENIQDLDVKASNKRYEEKVKLEIDDILKLLPGAVFDELVSSERLKNNLWIKIQDLNSKYLAYIKRKEKKTITEEENPDSIFTKKDHEYNVTLFEYETSFENEILKWLNQHIKDQNINHIHIAEVLIRRLEPLLLNESVHYPKYKLIIKGEIFEVLYDLSLNSIETNNRIIYLNKCAEDLANKLLSIRIRHENIDFNQLDSTPNAVVNQIVSAVPFRFTDFSSTKRIELEDIEEEISSTCTEMIEYDKFVKDDLQQVSGTFINPELSGVTIYTMQSQPVTSTPKKTSRKDIPKLNAEETAYMDKIARLIREWMETLPKHFEEDKNYKETIIYDLAGDIMDEVKLKQLTPDAKDSGDDKKLQYIVRRWLCRFNFFEDLREVNPQISQFISNLKKVPIPKLTKPQHGSRQAMKNIQHIQSEMRHEDFLPRGIDVLEDQISVWMNEQPSEIYANKDRGTRNRRVHELALILQDRLRSKSPDSEINDDINQWLMQVIKPVEREHVGILSENLQERIINAPQDETLETRLQKQKRYRSDYLEARRNPPPEPTEHQFINEKQEDPDKTIKVFISKFMEHNYDIADPMARGAFSHLLKNEIRKLSPLTRKEVYDNLGKASTNENFPPQHLLRELEYIKLISDWLKNIPIMASYNTIGNRRRIEFVNDLAKNIAEIESNRFQDPSELNHNMLIASVISHSIRTYELPILPEYKTNENVIIEQLVKKIVTNQLTEESLEDDSSIIDDNGIIQEQDLGQFVEQYVRINAREIGDDEVKLEVWSARLLKEIKKMVHGNDDPNTLNKVKMYNKFADIPIPGDESVRRFGLELEYIKEISEWLKNLPLLSVVSQPEAQQKQIEMITDLAEKMLEKTDKKTAAPTDTSVDINTDEYVRDWISKLSLDPQQEVIYPIVIQQLLKRIDKVTRNSQPKGTNISQSSVKSSTDLPQTGSKDYKKVCCSDVNSLPDPGKHIVDAIEIWCNNLPIEGDRDAVKSMKNNIAINIYQKIGEINVDPTIFNDDLLYQEMLEDEIDTQLENIPQNPELQNKRDTLKTELIGTILQAKNIAQVKSAGENYKHKLETTINVSIPNPLQPKQNIDPGFEMYKSHLADIFILENFDHGNDDVKIKYEKQIRDEIDKYFINAQSKNFIPLSKDEIYNELYSALFKVPIPCGKMMVNEVEKIKTRCEIETWFDELPLQEVNGLHEQLERDKIVEMLSKRLYDIEKNEKKCNEKSRTEITKWLHQLPLLTGEENNIELFADKLLERLKSTTSARKCVTTEPKKQNKKKLKNRKGILGTSQIAGPSSAGKNWVSPPSSPGPKACCNTLNIYKKPAECIVEIVGEWCANLPVVSETEEVKTLKENVATNIMMKIMELNSNPEYVDNDLIYNELLDEELERLLANLPAAPEFKQSIPARKYQLKEMISSIKPLLNNEKERYQYKEKLKNVIDCLLEEPQNATQDKMELFNDLKEEIFVNFLQYNYDKYDEARQIYKNNVHDAIIKYVNDFKKENIKDPLILRNQLLCELSKIPKPSENVVREIMGEINMKQEVEFFFQDIPFTKHDKDKVALLKQIKAILSKCLADIERSGHNCANHRKMKAEITKCFRKLDLEVDPAVVDTFINKLKDTESSRKLPLARETRLDPADMNYESFRTGANINPSKDSKSPQTSPVRDSFHQSIDSPYVRGYSDRTMNEFDVEYDEFRRGAGFTSSRAGLHEPAGRATVPPARNMTFQSPLVADISLDESVTPSDIFQAPNFSQITKTNLPQLNLGPFSRTPPQTTIPGFSSGAPQQVTFSPVQVPRSPAPFPMPHIPDQSSQSANQLYKTLQKTEMTCQGPQSLCQVAQNSNVYQAVPSVNQVSHSSGTKPQTFRENSPNVQHSDKESCMRPEDVEFNKTYIQNPDYDEMRSPYASDIVERSLGASDVTFGDFNSRNFIKSSIDPSKRRIRLPQTPENIPIKTTVPPSPYFPPQEENGSITHSSLFVGPDMGQMGNFSQFNLREFDETVPRVQLDSDDRAPLQFGTGGTRVGYRMADAPASDTSDSEDGACRCVKRFLSNCNRRPYCMPPLEEYCSDCGGFGPMWWRMCPGFMFY